MSTKTTFKRVALVAVAALGMGMMSAVPSSAAAATPTAIVAGTIPTAQVGVVNTTPVTVTFPGGASDTFSINVRVTSAPAGSQYRSLTSNLTTGVAATGNTVKAKLNIAMTSTNDGLVSASTTGVALTDSVTVANTYTASTATSTAKAASFNISFTPDVAGSYTLLVSTHSEIDNVVISSGAGHPYAAGDASVSYTSATASTAASVVLAAVTGTGIAGGTGTIFKATIKDSAGAVSQLGANETITFAKTSGSGTITIGGIKSPSTSGSITGAAATYTADNSDFTNGVGYFQFTNSGTETAVITATGAGLLPATVTSTLSITTKTDSAATGAAFTDSTAQAAAIALGAGGHKAVTGTYASTASKAATSHSYTVTYGTPATIGTTALYNKVSVVDTSGKITGVKGATYDIAAAISASDTTTTAKAAIGDTSSVSMTATLSTAGNSFTVTTGGATLTVTSATAAVTTITPSPATTVRQAHGSSTAITFKVTDQFGAAVANEALSVSTTGRNASTSATALATDASGLATYTRADAGTSATVLTQDVVTATSGSVGTVTGVVTINYSTIAVATITCTSGAELDTATSVTYRDISSGDGLGAGAEAGAASLCTVTVKDANGAILVGVPVTVTTSSAGAAVLSTSATLYTGSAGTVAPKVYAWTSGAKVFTVTAGSVTSTETVNFHQETAAEVRSISAVASGNTILVTAKDRFGNVVPGVRIYGTRTGNGLFGGGSATANAITGAPTVDDSSTGVAEFIFNAGSSDSVVKFQVASAADTPSATFGETSAIKGSLDDGTTMYTASAAGTALKAEVGVGSTFDAAGVNTTTVASAAGINAADTAADAAAEATDAANAATDAANAAAEAADAATAAAQDAADAVAALSAQVATLISGLKAQLTALTNLVIKIQKKVKA